MLTRTLNYPVVVKKLSSLFLIVAGSFLIALAANLRIELWFTPVPITMQTAAILALGLLLGPNGALASTLLYLFEGIVGLPVFACKFPSVGVLLGPTAGYLWAFPLAAYLVGVLVQKSRHPLNVLLSLLVGSASILFAGTLWLSYSMGWTTAFMIGFYPFIVGEIAKVWVVFSSLYLTKAARIFFTRV